jgi:hypothetical protein
MPFPRRTLLTTVLVLASAALARAGDYHDRGTLRCGECHVMHTSQPAAPAEGDAGVDVLAAQGVGQLLKKDVNDLCLSCHDDSSSAPDVLGRNRGNSVSDVRQAGYLNRVGDAYPLATGHTLGSRDVAPGSSPAWRAQSMQGLTCIDCHTHHGSTGPRPAYRNLRSDAGNNRAGEGLVTYNQGAPGALDPTADVFQRRARDYDESAVDFNEPDQTDSAIARYCAGCHGEFHGQAGAESNVGGVKHGSSFTRFLRHPAAGVDVGAAGEGWSRAQLLASRKNRVKVMSPSASWGRADPGATPTCITCHKAHGNGNAFGLIFRSGHGTVTENGDTGGSRPEDLCGQCHDTAAPLSDPLAARASVRPAAGP